MQHQASSEDRAYLGKFLKFQIDAATFHHQEHLRIAYTLLAANEFNAAFGILKSSILGLLEHLGVGSAKYHETLTFAWLLLVHHTMAVTPGCSSFADFIRSNSELLNQRLLFDYYSETLLNSASAKAQYVPPDIAAIPLHGLHLA